MYKTSDVFDLLKSNIYNVFAVLDEDNDVEALFTVRAPDIHKASELARAKLKAVYEPHKPSLIDELFEDEVFEHTTSSKAAYGNGFHNGAQVEQVELKDAYKKTVFDTNFTRYDD